MVGEFFERKLGEYHITSEKLGSAKEPQGVPNAPFWGYDVYCGDKPFLTVRINDCISEDLSPTIPRVQIRVNYYPGSGKPDELPNIFSVPRNEFYHGASRQTVDRLVRDQLTHIIEFHRLQPSPSE